MALMLLLQLLTLCEPPHPFPKPEDTEAPNSCIPGRGRSRGQDSLDLEGLCVTHTSLQMLAEFFLEEVTLEQGGSYRCCYQRPGWGPTVCSHPSDALELLVTDELPRPSLVALPGPVVAPGANVSLRCAGRLRGMSFALYREGMAAPLQYRHSAQPWADFPLLGVRAPGTYSCYYHTPSVPYVLSESSEPLVISLDGSSSLDYTRGNLVRLGLAGLVLISLGTLLVFDWRSQSPALGSAWP
ncbi:osteoclast-associated immunoglobulin-like receptor isoform X4 [Diceros bicornis minor]|uniref:osteoclast-associated immunoglobulin-like receptor isoform X4 n=1 Tax=Diceros bicornis minor TaxID=77932 RepID=UPI0026ECED45|nr:osteoclast-associated immunoglobulin-like receptor isoform X4 [Diceros bicornis minor]